MCFFKKRKARKEAEKKRLAEEEAAKAKAAQEAKKKEEAKKAEAKKTEEKKAPAKASEKKVEKKEAPKAKTATKAPAKKSSGKKDTIQENTTKNADGSSNVDISEVDEDGKKNSARTYHISKRKTDGKWQIKFGGSEKVIKTFDTQAEAIEHAKGLAERNEHAISIHKTDGKIRKQRY